MAIYTYYTYDAHKNIETIEYNYLNLPAKITFTDNRTITFLYDATGKKLRKTVSGNGQQEQRDYLDGIEYKDGKPDQFLHSEGSVRMDKDGQFKYYFVLRDHLGNTRVTFSDLNNDDEINEKEEIIQINNYYAFGLNMEGNWNGANGANKYQYNGKEWNDDFGLGWNDYGARFYDPAMARWQTVDPLSEKYVGWSPYNYTMNNPIRFIDPDGQSVESTDVRKNKDDTYTVVNAYDDGDNNVYVVNDEGKRTGEKIAKTLTPIDFMSTDDSNGKLYFAAEQSGVTFDLKNLKLSGALNDGNKCHNFKDADGAALIALLSSIFKTALKESDIKVYKQALQKLAEMSANGKVLDIKVSADYAKYRAVGIGIEDGLPTITTLRAIGNIAFGMNLRDLKLPLVHERLFYSEMMDIIGKYNQSQNGGNGYNKGWPFYGEHRYSGTFIYLGYFKEYPPLKK